MARAAGNAQRMESHLVVRRLRDAADNHLFDDADSRADQKEVDMASRARTYRRDPIRHFSVDETRLLVQRMERLPSGAAVPSAVYGVRVLYRRIFGANDTLFPQISRAGKNMPRLRRFRVDGRHAVLSDLRLRQRLQPDIHRGDITVLSFVLYPTVESRFSDGPYESPKLL